MNLAELRLLLDRNVWEDPTDVIIIVDNGNGDGYDLTEVFDHGNSITLTGDLL